MYKHKKITRTRFSNKKYSPIKYLKHDTISYSTYIAKKTKTHSQEEKIQTINERTQIIEYGKQTKTINQLNQTNNGQIMHGMIGIEQIFMLLNEIQRQNEELRHYIENDVKSRMDEGFQEVKSDLKFLKKQQQSQNTRINRLKQSSRPKLRKFASIKLEESQQITPEGEAQGFEKLEVSAESTFMRNLDQTQQQIEQSHQQSNETQQDMRLSLGANLLQMMQFNNKTKQNKKPLRNFNFRCNLQEIDKIIEEDAPNSPQTNATMENTQNMIDVKEINASIEKKQQEDTKEEEDKGDDIEFKRPQTGQRRKAWGVNLRKSIKKQQSSKERPQTAAVRSGLRLRGVPQSKKENEDPILALLSQETSADAQIQSVTNETTESKEIVKDEQFAEIEKQMPLQQIVQETNQIEEEPEKPKPVIEMIPEKKPLRSMPQRRGMFKAPPPNLIEQLLMDEAPCETQNNKPLVEPEPSNPIKMNNFFEQTKKNEEIKMVRKNEMKFPTLDIGDDEDETEGKQDEEDNPFNNNTAFGQNNSSEENDESNLINLFFNRKNEVTKSDTAEFGK